MSSSDEASSDSDAEGDAPPRPPPPPRQRERTGRGAPPPAMGNLPLKALKEDGSGAGEDDDEDDRSPRSMTESRDGGRMSKRREGLSISGDQGGDAPPLQEEARSKVKQAIVISFGPEDPKGCGKTHLLRHVYTLKTIVLPRQEATSTRETPRLNERLRFLARGRQEMLMMLQFVQTLQDLEMFVQKYQDDLVRANTHTTDLRHT